MPSRRAARTPLPRRVARPGPPPRRTTTPDRGQQAPQRVDEGGGDGERGELPRGEPPDQDVVTLHVGGDLHGLAHGLFSCPGRRRGPLRRGRGDDNDNDDGDGEGVGGVGACGGVEAGRPRAGAAEVARVVAPVVVGGGVAGIGSRVWPGSGRAGRAGGGVGAGRGRSAGRGWRVSPGSGSGYWPPARGRFPRKGSRSRARSSRDICRARATRLRTAGVGETGAGVGGAVGAAEVGRRVTGRYWPSWPSTGWCSGHCPEVGNLSCPCLDGDGTSLGVGGVNPPRGCDGRATRSASIGSRHCPCRSAIGRFSGQS